MTNMVSGLSIILTDTFITEQVTNKSSIKKDLVHDLIFFVNIVIVIVFIMLVWIQAEEQMKTGEEERKGLETEREELHKQLQLSNTEVSYH